MTTVQKTLNWLTTETHERQKRVFVNAPHLGRLLGVTSINSALRSLERRGLVVRTVEAAGSERERALWSLVTGDERLDADWYSWK